MIQTNDPLLTGTVYNAGSCLEYKIIAKMHDIICLEEQSIGVFLIPEYEFRQMYTAINPVKIWPDIPNIHKQYGICFCGGTKYGYDWITKTFVSLNKITFDVEGNTTQSFFEGFGNIKGCTNNYEIRQFNTVLELLNWLY